MKLEQLIRNCGVVSVNGDSGIEISFATNDSRKAVPGTLFVAVSGCGNDGREYIAAAARKGATAVIYEDNGCAVPEGVTAVKVGNSRLAAAMVADEFYGHPSRDLRLTGITGTNGKTTTVTLLYNMFRSLGYECGLLSTIANYVGPRKVETANTTSDPFTINSLMSEMVKTGCEYCFMEVSSIGLEQDRVSGLDFDVAIFSNLTHDHLDYHGTFAEYIRCKKLFFDNLGKNATAIINADDRNGDIMVQNTAARVVTYSCRNAADHQCRILEQSFEGMLLKIDGTEVYSRLIGGHNAYNLLAIHSAATALGVEKEEALVALSRLESAPGRLENLHGPRGLNVIIDYAHTPDALENVLKTLREVSCEGSLICLFGCGGDRDRSKRPEMAAVAEKYADRIFITADNSRSERTEDIIEEIRAGLSPVGAAKAICIADRREAIRAAIMTAPQGSAILLAGKGHENYQILANGKIHFDEHEIVGEIFKQMN